VVAAGERYTAVAVVLHWAIAAAILLNLFVGAWMHEALEDAATRGAAIAAYQLHKSVGLTVLALSLLRLAWRLAHRPPPLPATMRRWERTVARGVHWAFYALMVAVPLSGWLYVSTQWREDAPLNVPTLWFGLFEVPHLFGLDTLAAEARQAMAQPLEEAHEVLAWSMAVLLVLHVLAALKHRFVDRDTVFASMRPLAGTLVAVLVVAAIVAAGATSQKPAAGAVAESIRGVPGGWVIEPGSEIAFAGEHAGTPFRGRFTRWEADIRLDPQGTPGVAVTVETASATDGVALHDQTLREAEWFDAGRHPQARYSATRVAPRAGGGYALEGTLTIKDRTLAVPPLAAVLDADGLRITGSFALDRAEANLGMESDPSGEYVSRRILVEVDVTATPPR
jgi:cytochrome b561/polyisoprenoid-binding protein YceI